MNGYDEAANIDAKINQLLADFPIQPSTAIAWANFTRVIQSTLNILQPTIDEALEKVMKGTKA